MCRPPIRRRAPPLYTAAGTSTYLSPPHGSFDRLNVLAEASRQVGATNDPGKSGVYTSQANGEGIALDPALQNALQEEDFFSNQDYYTTKPSKFVLTQPRCVTRETADE